MDAKRRKPPVAPCRPLAPAYPELDPCRASRSGHAAALRRRSHALSPRNRASDARSGTERKALVRTDLRRRRLMPGRKFPVFPVYAGSPEAASARRVAGIKSRRSRRRRPTPAVSDRTFARPLAEPLRFGARTDDKAGRANPPSPSARSGAEALNTIPVPEGTGTGFYKGTGGACHAPSRIFLDIGREARSRHGADQTTVDSTVDGSTFRPGPMVEEMAMRCT